MIRALVVAACLLPAVALAQSSHDHCQGSAAAWPMTHGAPMVDASPAGASAPAQPGQGAFAAIQEIVEILWADPATDWSKVNIDALRQHLVDMSNVTLSADVQSEMAAGGERFIVTGTGAIRDSIRRMVTAHAAAMDGVDGWHFQASEIEGGAVLLVRAPEQDAARLRGLGFFGVLARGMHHQQHHLMIARGEHPHG